MLFYCVTRTVRTGGFAVDPPIRVFLSSTYEDLSPYRDQVMKVLVSCEAVYKGMEYFGASQYTSLDLCLKQVEDCNLFICLLGTRYGSRPPGNTKSYTELEIERAIELHLPILVYALDVKTQPMLKKPRKKFREVRMQSPHRSFLSMFLAKSL